MCSEAARVVHGALGDDKTHGDKPKARGECPGPRSIPGPERPAPLRWGRSGAIPRQPVRADGCREPFEASARTAGVDRAGAAKHGDRTGTRGEGACSARGVGTRRIPANLVQEGAFRAAIRRFTNPGEGGTATLV
ncbi:hypothetical protein Kpho01_55880 [Kitasatospora phosalacinea]|uniref:Uncharacterized protein n=1 Tax=Kitasatospora phosalacinea TaxID=2065 RepID=A0A9W6PMQ8_9ACTN|nr:hypothetical protein Kpho01_55880 [Kitasatospora phosalacinea]